MLGTSLGAAGSYYLSRRFGRETFVELARGRPALLDGWLGDRSFVAVLYVRLLPVVPFAVVNYVSGVSSVRFGHFLVATVMGIVPGTFLFAAVGGSFDHPNSAAFSTAIGLVVMRAVLEPLLRRVVRRPAG
ncbi:MAG: VTT domain-containing protein [Actinomycetota bacterium]|nr:VTT domain-containing protein [Actinomycetota bacterium]